MDSREAARLKAEGLSHDQIAERFGLQDVKRYIAVGFYPQRIWDICKDMKCPQSVRDVSWREIRESLDLRVPPSFELQAARGGIVAVELAPSDYAKFDYSEVIGYFEKIADGTLDSREKRQGGGGEGG